MNAKSTFEYLTSLPPSQAIMLVSNHGMGKSSIVHQAAEQLNIPCVDIRLANSEVGDVKGMPEINKDIRRVEFYKPWWWPREDSPAGFLFLDEINRANREVRQAVFELVLDRRLDGEELPPSWRIVAAINGDENYQVDELDHAFLDRFFKIDFSPTEDEWIEWASKDNRIHESIISFISHNKELLDPPSEMIAGTVYPSRRSWDKFNESMTHMGLWEKRDAGKITQLGVGWLGRPVSIKFAEYFLKNFKLIRPEEIVNDWDSVKKELQKTYGNPAEISTISGRVGNFILLLDEITDEQYRNIREFIMTMPKEIAASLWNTITQNVSFRKKMISMKSKDPELLKYVQSIYLPS